MTNTTSRRISAWIGCALLCGCASGSQGAGLGNEGGSAGSAAPSSAGTRSGGSDSGGTTNSGGQSSGGEPSGGKPSTGGSSSGGTAASSGGTAATGGGSSGGATNSGGQSPTGGSSSGGSSSGGTGGTSTSSGGTGGFVEPRCANGVSNLPSDAPKLAAGVWTPVNPPVSFGPHSATRDQDVFTQGVAIDPCNPATLYLCVCTNPASGTTATPGLYRSTNAGTTWTRLGPFDGPIHVRVDPNDPKHLYVVQGVRGNTAGFWVSTDGGQTFNSPDSFTAKANNSVGGWTSDAYDVAADPADFKHLLVSFHSPFEWSGSSGILESKDGGDTWIRHFPVGTASGAGWGIWFLSRPDPGIGNANTWLLGVQNGGGHWRTTDAGTTWTKVTSNSMDHGGGQIYYTKSGALFAGGTPNIMKSTDNGATWAMGGNPNLVNFGYIGIIGDGTHLYTSSHDRDAPFQTSPETDGITWANYNTQISHAGSFEMAYDATHQIVYSANEYDGLLALKVQ